MTFKAGELVELRTGKGPCMVCSGPNTDPFSDPGTVWCYWTIQGALRREALPASVLRPYQGDEKPAGKPEKRAAGGGSGPRATKPPGEA
jgi:uncharacterized protein YodC (DUF2158 family)